MPRLVVILLLLNFAAAGSGVMAHIHRAQHRHGGHPHAHDAHHEGELDQDHQPAHRCHAHRHAGVNRAAVAPHTTGEHGEGCQTCLDLHLRALTCSPPSELSAVQMSRPVDGRRPSQVLVTLVYLSIDTTGPPAA